METNIEFRIEKGIPIPMKVGRTPIYPFVEMEVDDSVFIPIEPYTRSKHSMIANAARNAGRHRTPYWKYTTRIVEGGMRVWRVE